jgi:hypothetical protein
MAKEWILNSAMNRFQLNFKRNVGAVSEAIRKCAPKTLEEWKEYYFENVRSKEHIIELGRRLYIKITEVIQAEVEEITEEDCINYMFHMVIDNTFKGYITEIKTIYGQLQAILQKNFPDIKIEPALDNWDRLYNVDFFIKIKDKYIGLQIKPVSNTAQIPMIFQQRNQQLKTHKKFQEKFGGKVFYIFSKKENNKKVIVNEEVIDEIKKEIIRLS